MTTATTSPAPVLSDDRGRAREPDPPAWIIEGQCSVRRMYARGSDCLRPGAVPFAAVCRCGDLIEGWICGACTASESLGCLTCHRQGRHKCTVRFLEGES